MPETIRIHADLPAEYVREVAASDGLGITPWFQDACREALKAPQVTDIKPAPITALVALLDAYPTETWEHASVIAAHQGVADVCARMADIRRNRP